MTHLLLAATDGSNFFTATELGKSIGALMKAAALLVVLFAAVKGIKDAMAGKAGKAAQLVIGCAIVVTFLWDPSLIGKLIDLASSVVGKGVESVDQTAR
jgi:hypothetical protein